MTNKTTVVFVSIALFLLGLISFPKAVSKKTDKFAPLFGHFYPDKRKMIVSTNTLWVPNLRYGSGIR